MVVADDPGDLPGAIFVLPQVDELGFANAFGVVMSRVVKAVDADFDCAVALPANMLDARIATARGDRKRAIEYWKNAVETEDRLYYGEPPEWFYPVRESLGGALLADGQADQAEAVFRTDLEQYPRNPRSLFGLWKSLEVQKKATDAEWVRREFETAWKNADVKLELGDL